MRKAAFLLMFVAVAALAKTADIPSIYVAADGEKVRHAAELQLLPDGYAVQSDTKRQMVFDREEQGGAGLFAQAAMGNSHCPMPRRVVTLSIVEDGPGTQVFARDEISIAKAYCRWEKHELNNKKQRAALQGLLDRIKREAEK